MSRQGEPSRDPVEESDQFVRGIRGRGGRRLSVEAPEEESAAG